MLRHVVSASASGVKNATRTTFDQARKEEQDLTTVTGFLLALQGCLRLQKGGLLWLGCPCCSFSWMSSSKHGRSALTPLGDVTLPFVKTGNILASRSLILALICLCRGVYYFIEQPGGSYLDHFPYLQWMLHLGIPGLQSSCVRW